MSTYHETHKCKNARYEGRLVTTRLLMILLTLLLAAWPDAELMADTLQVNITPPNAMNACSPAEFKAVLSLNQALKISIKTSLSPNTTANNCATNGILLAVDTNSSTPQFDSLAYDTIAGIWSAWVSSSNQTDTIFYTLYVDCSVLSSTFNSNLQLKQTWSASVAGLAVIINNADSVLQTALRTPYLTIVNLNDIVKGGAYPDTVDLVYQLLNTGNAPARIRLKVKPSQAVLQCDEVRGDSLYAWLQGSYKAMTYNTFCSFLIDVGDTLEIHERVIVQRCLSDTCNDFITIEWRCDSSIAIFDQHCNACQAIFQLNRRVKNEQHPILKMETMHNPGQLDFFDLSCMNDTVSAPDWKFLITNTGKGQVQQFSLFLGHSGGDEINTLSLIDTSSFKIEKYCQGCVVNKYLSIRTKALCNSLYAAALDTAVITVSSFSEGDTLIVSFKTIRCATADTNLYNIPKRYHQWYMEMQGVDTCQQAVSIAWPNGNTAGSYFIHSNSSTLADDLDLSINFTPQVSDLSVAPGAAFGDTAQLSMEINGVFSSPYDYQLLSCTDTSLTSCNLHGYLRITLNCETGLQAVNNDSLIYLSRIDITSGSRIKIYPVYFDTDLDTAVCTVNTTHYYFDLRDSLMQDILKNGELKFSVRACCKQDTNSCCEQEARTKYKVYFELMANPNMLCDSLLFPGTGNSTPPAITGVNEWIPLRKTKSQIAVHCPGCKAPGIIVYNYYMQRQNYGLQDSDNDEMADDALTPIQPSSAWFSQYSSMIRQNNSSYGDQLSDFMASHFQDGDFSNGGYNYMQMDTTGARLHAFQVSRSIPYGYSTMRLKPNRLTFYLDVPVQTGAMCLDCDSFHIDSGKWKTVLKIAVNQLALSPDFLQIDTVSNEYLFSFSLDSVTGNLRDSAFIVYQDSGFEWRFAPGQGYRLKTDYSVCGNFFNTNPNAGIEDTRLTSEIANRAWLSGRIQSLGAFGTVDKMPNDTIALDTLGYTVTAGDLPDTLLNEYFARHHIFYCETYGAFHYFFSNDYAINSFYGEDDQCDKFYEININTTTANNLLDVYPFEYMPPRLGLTELQYAIPAGYTIGQINYRSRMRNRQLQDFSFPPQSQQLMPPITGMLSLDVATSFPSFSCWPDSVTQLTQPYLFTGSAFSGLDLRFTLHPEECIHPFAPQNHIANLGIDRQNGSCTTTAACALTNTIRDSSLDPFSIALSFDPGLQSNLSIDTVIAEQNVVCKALTFTVSGMAAPHVFLAVPDTNLLQNWMWVSGGDTISVQQGIIPITSKLSQSLSGRLCVVYDTCLSQPSSSILLGWSCDSISTRDSLFSACFTDTLDWRMANATTKIITLGKSVSHSFKYCAPIEMEAVFTSADAGNAFPDIIRLDSLPPYMLVDSVVIARNGKQHPLTLLDYHAQRWQLNKSDLASILIHPDSFKNGMEFKITAYLHADCLYQPEDGLPKFILHYTNFCGKQDSTYTLRQKSLTPIGSECFDCFELTKYPTATPVSALDTTSFIIKVCANNKSLGTVGLNELFPPNFIVTAPLPLPTFLNPPAQGCDSLQIYGYFTQAGSCADNLNTVEIVFWSYDSLNRPLPYFDTLTATACVEVTSACLTANTIIIPDSTYSSSLGTQSMNNSQIYISGTFFIDQSISFNFCQILMAAGAVIQVQGNALLNLYHTQITACDSMWQGVRIEYDGQVFLEDSCLIADAHVAINAGPKGIVKIIHSELINNHIGLEIPPLYPHIYAGLLYLYGARFGMNAPFRPDYPHQPAHGKRSFAGIQLHDAVLKIGSNSLEKNVFFGMNNGIKAYRSILNIYNTAFTDIQPVPFYHNGSNENSAAISIVGDNESKKVTPSYLHLHPNPDGSPNVTNSRCGVYAAITTTEVQNCVLDSVEYGIDEQFLDIGIYSTLVNNTIHASKYGIRLMENDGSDYILVEGNTIEMIGNEKSAVGIYVGESYARHTTSYTLNSNQVQIANATAGIQTAGVSNASLSYNTIALQNPGTYTAPSTTGIDIGGGAGNFLSCNHVSGHQVTDSLRYGYRVTQSPFDSLNCNVADSVGYSFRFEGAACMGTRLKGNYMGNAYCGLYLNSEAIIGQQPQLISPSTTFHGNVWLNASRYNSGYGAVNLNDASFISLQASIFITDQNITNHNPVIPLDSTLGPFHVDDNSWFFPQNSGASFDCNRSNVCNAALQDSGDWKDDQLRMSVINDSNISSLFIPESKQIASQLIYADLKMDATAASVTAYLNFLHEKENSSEGILYQTDSIDLEIRISILNRNDFLSGLIEQHRILSDSILMIDSMFTTTHDTALFQQKENFLFQFSQITEDVKQLTKDYSIALSSNYSNKEQLNFSISPQQTPDANIKEAERISLLYKENGLVSISDNYTSLFQLATQCPSAGGPAVFVARNLIKLFNDSIVYDDANICMQLGILRVANQQQSGKTELAFALQPNPANYVVQVVLDNNEMKTYQLQIFNTLGQNVFNKEYTNIFSTIQFSVSAFEEGLYTVVIRDSAGQQMTKKLVIVR